MHLCVCCSFLCQLQRVALLRLNRRHPAVSAVAACLWQASSWCGSHRSCECFLMSLCCIMTLA